VAEDRPRHSGRPPDRPPFQQQRFRPALPRPESGGPPPHTLRVRDGERELEVSGSPAFVRQVLDDLAGVWAQLRGEKPPSPASIRMPAPHTDGDAQASDHDGG